MKRSFAWLVGSILICAYPVFARAQPITAAQALSDEGWRLFNARKYAEACSKFEASLELEPHLKTRASLAACYQSSGRIASAWSLWRDISNDARAAGEAEAEIERRAQRYMNELSPRLTMLVLVQRTPKDGTTIKLDGRALPTATLGVPLPVDQGPHTVEVTARGFETWTRRIDVGLDAEGQTITLGLGPLTAAAPLSTEMPPKDSMRAPTSQVGFVQHDPDGPSRGRGQRIAAGVVGGLGLGALAAGAVLTVMAKSDWDASRSDCDANNVCGDEGYDQATSARKKATIATIVAAAGAGAVFTSVVLWLTAPSGRSPGRTHSRVVRIIPSLSLGYAGVAVESGF